MEHRRNSEELFGYMRGNHSSWLPRRYLVALLSFFGFANIYAMRVNLSVAIVVMARNKTVILPNGTQTNQLPEFDWENGVEGIILSSFFYGYILTQVIGGWLACKYGGKNLFGMGVGVTAFFTVLTPFLARTSVYLLVIGRVVEGLFEGVTFPAMYGVWSKWSPPEERSRLVAISYSGCYFGTVAALPLCGALAERLGWPSIFYVFGIIGCIWTVVWLMVISETPNGDKYISEAEKEYIEDSLGTAVRVRLNIPWKDIFKSLPVWAIIVAHFCENWGFYTLLTELPSYMNDVFEFDLHSAGLLAALPYLAMGIIVQTSGFLADWFRTTGHLTTTQVRILFTCTGFGTRALFLLAAAYSEAPLSIVASLTVAVGFGGLAYGGFNVNHLDIAPQYASVLMGISNTFATLPGILSPVLTSYIVQNKTPKEWRTIFHISVCVYTVGSIVYSMIASGKAQPWALVGQEQVFFSDNEHSQTSTEDLIAVPPPRMCEELHLERLNNRISWGFRMTGGLDFGTPLSIIKVTGGSVAEIGGVQVGDLVQEINGQQTKNFTHTDAQNCIAKAQNHLRLLVLRGSMVTPPLTPLRGMTPDIGYAENGHCENLIRNENLNERFPNSTGDGFKDAPITQQKTGNTVTVTKPKYSVNEKGQLLAGDRVLTDVEIAELITGNEEVLDEGVLGINFKKFLPQVDFIRKSEVFKLLQNENTKKEIPEHIQLKKDPNKRFSTFLQKPKGSKEISEGPKFLHFKPPRFLPKPPEKKFEWPVLKPWERPKKPTPEPPIHSVLWLFLEEKGEEIIGGRWGSEAEERENMSRNSFIEYDRDSICSSMKLHDDDSASVTSKEFGRESQMSRIDESLNEVEDPLNGGTIAQAESDKHDDLKKLKYSWYIEQQEGDISEIRESMMDVKKEISDYDKTTTGIRKDILNATEEMKFEEGYYAEDVEQRATTDRGYIKNVETNDLLSQLYDIQYQIEALENEVSNDVQTQLLAVKEQLSKIVDAKTSHRKTCKVEEEEQFEAQIKGNLKTAEKTVHYEKLNAPDGKEIFGVVGNKEIISRDTSVHEESRRTVQENVRSDVVSTESVNKKGNITETVEETIETFEAEISEHQEYESTQVEIEGFKGYQYEILEAPDPDVEIITIPIKKKITPITPQRRPIVLPGGRMWRNPKDAEHEEFYQGILVAQADVLVGSTENVNYTKYMPPKIDMSTSEVYRLIHETEDPIKKNNMEETLKEKNYCEPISKRHFYAATLREPKPIGVVELSDL